MRKNEKVGKTTTRRKQKAVISKSKRNKEIGRRILVKRIYVDIFRKEGIF